MEYVHIPYSFLFNYIYDCKHDTTINDLIIDLIILLSHVTLELSTLAKLNRTGLINRDNLGITDVKLADRNLYLL